MMRMLRNTLLLISMGIAVGFGVSLIAIALNPYL
jgi:hypothetical protein